MDARHIRQEFIKYFSQHGHRVWASASLVPDNDPSVLLTTAGMQQFKPYFLGQRDPQEDFKSRQLITIQKCFRTSDIDGVGDTSHLTFFEMLGNFSFGQYWKPEAIAWAWEFLTKTMHLSADRLWVTIYGGDQNVPRDKEAEQIWLKYVPAGRIIACGRADNFWGPPGATGPCGPCSEIHWQLTDRPQGQPNDQGPGFVEIWNLVFMEYNLDHQGKLSALPQQNIDTGLGLERLAMITQKQPHIFATDIFRPLLDIISKTPGFGDSVQPEVNERRARIVADHIRAACFLLADGVRFSNKDQGYILRRLVRRAADQFLVMEFNFDLVVRAVIEHFGPVYPEIKVAEHQILENLNAELENYRKVLALSIYDIAKKMHFSDEAINKISATNNSSGASHIAITADEAFNVAATHGISLDRLERLGFLFDKQAVEIMFTKHRAISRAGQKKKFGGHGINDLNTDIELSDDDRQKMTRLHTSTHLLHAALRDILGAEIRQQGSDINPERLRFDFSFHRALTDDEKKSVEMMVNQHISENLAVEKISMPLKEALKSGALAFFREKYSDQVTVYSIGQVSKELCAGPHVTNTSAIGHFRLINEQSIGRGLRRIKAVVE